MSTAVKGLVWYGCRGFLDLPPAGILKGGEKLVDGVAPGLIVNRKYRSLVVVNAAGTEDLLEGVFKMFL